MFKIYTVSDIWNVISANIV